MDGWLILYMVLVGGEYVNNLPLGFIFKREVNTWGGDGDFRFI